MGTRLDDITVADNTALDALLEKVYLSSGYDFRRYRRGMVIRRLRRRLYTTGVTTCAGYMQFLDTHPGEYQRLAEDLTIKVSSFFRSPNTFRQVSRLVLPQLASGRLRVWSTACANGEEPYSIAILLTSFLGNRDFKIYATDISRRALQYAQAGIYKNIEGIPDTFSGYFTRCGDGYAVSDYIKQRVSFSYFDLVSTPTPPWVDIDCIFCCNVLIYLQRQLQEQVLGMLYNSLATSGYLILGEAETPTASLCQRLKCIDTRARIYIKAAPGSSQPGVSLKERR